MTTRRPQVRVSFAREQDVASPEFETQTSLRGRRLLSALALALLATLPFLAILHAKPILTDPQEVGINLAMRSTSDALRTIWLQPRDMPTYAPLAWTSLLAECRLFGGVRPARMHAMNLLLHAANAVMLWEVLRRLRIPGAFAAAAIFAVHPLHVATLAWIAQRGTLLCGLFSLAAVVVGSRVFSIRGDSSGVGSMRMARVALVVLTIFAALCAPAGAVVPFVLLVLIWWDRGGLDRAALRSLTPLLVLGAMLFTGVVLAGRETNELTTLPTAAWVWAYRLLVPVVLPVASDGVASNVIPVIAVVMVTLALAVAFQFRNRLGRGPFATLAMYVMLFVGDEVGVHRLVPDPVMYLAGMPLIAGCAAVVASAIPVGASLVGGGIAIAALATATWVRAPLFADDASIWAAALHASPNSTEALIRLARIELDGNNPRRAGELFTRVLSTDPQHPTALLGIADAYAARGELERAIQQYHRVLSVRPDDAEAHLGLALALNADGNSTGAMRHLRRAIELRGRDARAHLYLGRVHQFRGEIDDAEACYRRAIELAPLDPDPLVELAMVRFYKRDDLKEAQALLERAKDLNPRNPAVWLNLGVMQFELTRRFGREGLSVEQQKPMLEQAANWLGQAALVDPTLAVAFTNRGKALLARSRIATNDQERVTFLNEAIDALDRAAELGDGEARQLVQVVRNERDGLPPDRR